MQKRLAATALVLLLAACGQKGNLYLPADREQVPAAGTSAASQTASPDASQDADAKARRRAARGTTGN